MSAVWWSGYFFGVFGGIGLSIAWSGLRSFTGDSPK